MNRHRCAFGRIAAGAVLAALPAASALAGENLPPWFTAGGSFEPGVVTIEVRPEYSPLNLDRRGDLVVTGLPALDEVCRRFRVHRIEKLFRMKTTPDDPTIPDLSRFYTVRFPEAFDPVQAALAFKDCPEVELAEPEPVRRALYTPNDPRFRSQWHLERCRLEDAWNVSHGDPDILIGIVDSGIDMNVNGDFSIHEDLQPNLWVNPGEDLNHDGVIDFDEWNERDDDHNGYVDDFYGWDFTGRDNWPDDPWGARNGHGTHVAGIAAAATDNRLGVAGAAFNCRLVIAACYHPQYDSLMFNTNPGIEYCVNVGVRAINLSFGYLGGPSGAENAVIQYALRNNVAVFAGAGNDGANDRRNNAQHFYPCAYDGVIGVSASDDRDLKPQWANYGDYTDLVTPGEMILSTYPRGTYASLAGTSMSSPLAAGIGALMLSVRPNLTYAQLLDVMQRTADDISAENAQYPGIRYRVNAGRLLNSTHPELEVTSWSLVELDGDGDGRWEAGETIGMGMVIRNASEFCPGNEIDLALQNGDRSVTIVDGDDHIGYLDLGAEETIPADRGFVFRIAAGAAPHYSTFTLRMETAEGWVETADTRLTLGIPFYALVDDDGGDDFETYYLSDLAQRPIVHDTWSVQTQGVPDAEDLEPYDFILWATGNRRNPLDAGRQAVLAAFLDAGGSLLLTGQFIGDDHGAEPFHQNYLHARHVADNTGQRQLRGRTGDPIADGVSLLMVGSGGAGNGGLSPSAMAPVGGADTLLTYGDTPGQGQVGGIVYTGQDYRLVYLGFALEAVTGIRSTPRAEFIQRVFDRFYILETPERSEAVPQAFGLSPVTPNPFNATANVAVSLPHRGMLTLQVVDLQGRVIAVLHQGYAPAGGSVYAWNAATVPAGVYLFRAQYDGAVVTQKALLLK